MPLLFLYEGGHSSAIYARKEEFEEYFTQRGEDSSKAIPILEYIDQEGWPHYKLNENLPNLKPGEQTILIKKAIINYFEKSNYID